MTDETNNELDSTEEIVLVRDSENTLDDLPTNPPPHPAKLTNVTGLVKDRDGVTWVNCGWKAVLVGYVGAPPIYVQDGTRVPTSFNGTVDKFGQFAGTLPANDTMIPPKTRWRITFFPLASSAPSTFDLSVSGATQNINTIITQSIVPPRFKLIAGNYGYADIEVYPAPKAGTPAASYLNTTTGNLRIWNGTTFVDVAQGALPAYAMQVAPHVNAGAVIIGGDPPTTTQLHISTLDTPNHLVRFASHTLDNSLFGGSFQFDTWDTAFARTKTMLFFGDGGSVAGYAFVFYADTSFQMGSKVSIYDTANAGKIAINYNNEAIYEASGVNASNYGAHTFRCSPLGNASHIDVVKIAPTNGGQVTINGALVVGAGAITAIATNANTTYLDAYGADVLTKGSLIFRSGVKGDTNPLPFVTFDGATRQANFAQDITCGAVHVNGGGSGFVTTTQPFLYLQTAAGGSVGVLNNMSVNGTFSATGAKTFNITHPLHPEKRLVHACLEGAEAGVYYRGEAKTDARGLCTIELPDYFEALTSETGRTVLLTVIDTDDAEAVNPLPMLASTRVKNGAFRVRSDIEYISFFWEVKAVRKDIAPLEVEPLNTTE